MFAVFFVVGLVAFTIGMLMWSTRRLDWVDSLGLGIAAGGLVMLVSGISMAPS